MSKKGATKTPKEPLSYEIRDVVLGKIRGYPPWPGMVVDPESVPPTVKRERPGKKSTFYCVRFFPMGDYAWLVSKDMSKLQKHEIQSYINEPFKKSGDLLEGYRIALDPKRWEEDVENAASAAGEEEANAEVDQLESADDGDASSTAGKSKKAVTKKRKRESESASKPKAAKKAKAKNDDETPAAKKKSPAKGKKNGAKSNTLVESEDEADGGAAEDDDEDAGPSKKASSPPAKRAKRGEKKKDEEEEGSTDSEALRVREWRHRLQKSFLGKTPPKEEDMSALDQLFTTIETYDKMNIQYLQFSKIGKVMRHVTALEDKKVPRDSEFKFRDRAKALVEQWHTILHKASDDVNGDAKEKEKSSPPDGEGKTDAVADKTAALDLNGKSENGTS
ncbi:hypothetical protein HGRIS_003182 [Hohenbuehelia grisea]|uniref:PWWP domain-containing protein n=1 Tax=Hohenbuehelia grisea TaxID=104357 RepID=A0ABR3JPU7_9AGAR